MTRTFPSSDGSSNGLKDVTLRVARGEFLCIVGPSGCGKSTVLNLIAGILSPESGEIRFRRPNPETGAGNRIGYMLARDSLLPWRTARSNVELSMEISKHRVASRSDAHRRASDLLKVVGLERFASYYPRQLSSGMRQRVALARTLACDPEVFLMDEPFGALDAQTRRLLQEEFIQIWSLHKKTVLFVTHDLVEALVLGDRVIVINGRPGTIMSEYRVDIPRPERLSSGIFGARLAELQEQLWRDLRATGLTR